MKIKISSLAIFFLTAITTAAFAQNAPPSGNSSASAVKKAALNHAPLIAAVDKNKDGCMSYEEWHAAGLPDSAWKIINPNAKNGCVNEQAMLDTGAPNGIDLNGDGELTLEEFIEFNKKMSAQMSSSGGAPQGPSQANNAEVQTTKSAPAFEPVFKKLDAGSVWVINGTTRLTGLTISEGASIKAPEGYSVTMTYYGVGVPIKPGVYKGDIVLTITMDIPIKYGSFDPYKFKTAVYVENGKYVPDKSVAAIRGNGKVTDNSADDLNINSKEEKFNGIIVKSDTKASYTINNPVITFAGNGGNDFAGYGAAIMCSGKSEVTINKARIVTDGAIRTAVFVDGESILHVNDSEIQVDNGILPADYTFTIIPGKMMEVPFPLGITGNCRATNMLENATVYYTNTHIKAKAWGALSTDGIVKGRLYVTKCLVETIESGYGAMSIGDCIDTFSGSTFNVADMALIMLAQGSGVFTDGTVVNSRRFGVMAGGGMGSGGDLTIEKGSVFNTKEAVIMLKGTNKNIVVDNAKLNPENGVILQVMKNDDPMMSGGGMPAGLSSGGGMPTSGMPSDIPSGGMPSGGMSTGNAGSGSTNITATFKNMTMNGDIINGDTAEYPVEITLKNATITGSITTATTKHAAGPNGEQVDMNHPELYKLLGSVSNTFAATDDKNGMSVSLDEKAGWIVDKTCFLTGLTIAKGANIASPKGSKLVMTIDGKVREIKPGDYKGKIVLMVSK